MKLDDGNIGKLWMDAASGRSPVDLVLKNMRLVNVFSGAVDSEEAVGIHKGRFVGPGSYQSDRIKDLDGMYLAPGFIDGHCHVESTMLCPREFARAVIPHGTTGVVADPHEIANVLGLEGIRYMLESSKGTPFRFHYMLPSCVPATHLETSGAILGAEELATLADDPMILGLGEMMNFPGVVFGDPGVAEKLARFQDFIIDGHAPGLSGLELNAYISAGIRSDHECSTLDEAKEKLAKGMWIMIRRGSTARNLEDLLPLVNEFTAGRCMLVTDDRTPEDLLESGHLDTVLAEAIDWGLDPVTAIRLVTLNPASYFGLRNLGAIGPGYAADGVILSSLKPPVVEAVMVGGRMVYEKGRPVEGFGPRATEEPPVSFRMTPLTAESIAVRAGKGNIRVIKIVPGQIVTRQVSVKPRIEAGFAVSDIERDILKIVVAERHKATGRVGVGFIRGFGLKKGAIASSVAHDSHNVIAVGANDEDILEAIETVAAMGGGIAVVDRTGRGERKATGRLPLPVAGIMSRQPLKEVARGHEKARLAAKALGCDMDDPFMALSFMALPVIPELKITDGGLVDVGRFDFVELFDGV